jgi:hypothetical protein
VVFEATEGLRLQAIKRSAERLLGRVLGGSEDGAVWSLREAVWPALCLSEFRDVQLQQVQLTLLSLRRIGQMEGRSGSLVLVGYFWAEGLGDLHSHPLVIKTRDRTKPTPERLDEEHQNALAVKPFAYDSKDGFAIPIFFDGEQEDYKVLWSICSLRGPLWPKNTCLADPEQRFQIDDLRTPLLQGDDQSASNTLDEVFDLLHNCHCRFNRARLAERTVGEEYSWYLRGFGSIQGPESVWGPEWVEVWGSKDDKFSETKAGKRINPLWLVEQLRPLRFPMYLGTIHGDLHPVTSSSQEMADRPSSTSAGRRNWPTLQKTSC